MNALPDRMNAAAMALEIDALRNRAEKADAMLAERARKDHPEIGFGMKKEAQP